jgi:phosphohistidine swiveling domain-containing protein
MTIPPQDSSSYPPDIELVKPARDLDAPELVFKQGARRQNNRLLVYLQNKRPPASIGSKAMNLWHLRRQGFRVPETRVLTWEACRRYRTNPKETLEKIRTELQQVLDPGIAYAVRSSADIEDSPDHSFAGQFTSVLDVRGVDQVIRAVQEVWSETQTERVRSYTRKALQGPVDIRMAVIIQKMVFPLVSGVAFSINPITSLDEITVEAVQGRGELLVQEGITPLRWVMKWGKWIEQPETTQVPQELIQQVVHQTRKISTTFKREVDLEWVFDGKDIYWVQMRDITAVAKADIYSNKIAKEMTPGMLKPLNWSVVVPIKSGVVLDLLTQVIGKNDLTADGLLKAFHYRTYHNLGAFGRIFDSLGMPRESLEIMMGVAPEGAGKPKFKPSPRFVWLLPRILWFLWDKWTFAKRAGPDFLELESELKKIPLSPPAGENERRLIKTIDEIAGLNRTAAYHSMVTILLMQAYNAIFRSQLKKRHLDPDDFNLTEGLDELKSYDPNEQLAALHRRYLTLNGSVHEAIRYGDYQAFQAIPGIDDFRREVEWFLAQFGHMSDRTTAIDSTPWRETPGLILNLIADFQMPPGTGAPKLGARDLPRRGIEGRLLDLFYQRARRFRLLREMYSSLHTYSIVLFRAYYMAIGDRLVERGLLSSNEDIHFLYDEEIRAYIAGTTDGMSFKDQVTQRRHEMERCKDMVLPQVIFGNESPPVILQSTRKLSGTPTSRGYYTGKTKVVQGIGDFKKLAPGDVLVIPHSDVGWLPLFAKAGAVIAESGGMLSHSSIVAREYGIPAVVSVSGALQLGDDLTVSIDGYKGEIHIHD